MFLTQYSTADAFLARAQADLERHEAANNLMIGIAVRLMEHPERAKTQPYLATVEDEGRLVAAAVMTPPHRVILHAESEDPAPLRLIAQDLIAGGWHVPGAFAEIWSAVTGQPHHRGMHERIYELRQVTPPEPAVAGTLRAATENDLSWACEWVVSSQFMGDSLCCGWSPTEPRSWLGRRPATAAPDY